MSKIGKKPVAVPDNVKVKLEGQKITVEGPAGTLKWAFSSNNIEVKHDTASKTIVVTAKNAEKATKAMHGTVRSIISSMMIGCEKGFERKLEVIGDGYDAKIAGKELVMQLGFTHPVKMTVPDGIVVTCPSNKIIMVKGSDKHQLGQFCADIKFKKVPDPYKTKGIKYADEVIRKKAGKTYVSGG